MPESQWYQESSIKVWIVEFFCSINLQVNAIENKQILRKKKTSSKNSKEVKRKTEYQHNSEKVESKMENNNTRKIVRKQNSKKVTA